MSIENAKWYVLHTYSGYENMVKDNLLLVFKKNDLLDKLVEITIPMEDVVEEKNGKRKIVQRRMMPCYVFVKMDYNNDMWHIITNTRGVTGFVGPGSKPVPLSDEEMESLGFGKTEVALDYAVGDTIVVTAGAWKDTIGAVKSINESKHTLTINVEMFGRETPVELNFTEVKHM